MSFDYELPDNDGDGVDDRWDQCLDEAENYNGFADNDGCGLDKTHFET